MDISHSDITPSSFYTWYVEICRHMLRVPSEVVKPSSPKDENVLLLQGDDLKVDDWIPIIVALRTDNSLYKVNIKSKLKYCPFLHDIDTEEKAKRLERLHGSLWTNYILCQLTKAIASLSRNSKVLTILELDGVPMFLEYLEHLLEGLKKNKTLKHLTFANCALKDKGCNILCEYLQNALNVEVINFTRCDLTSKSGEYIARLILNQQVHRVNCWPDEDLQKNGMDGIKEITLNCNSDLKDEGFNYILEELEDDMWIKALHLQACGITENISSKILEVINNNKSLEIVDLKNNYFLNNKTVERVQHLLQENHNKAIKTSNSSIDTTVMLQTHSKIIDKYFNNKYKKIIDSVEQNIQEINDMQPLEVDKPSTSNFNDPFHSLFPHSMYPIETIPQLIDFDSINTNLTSAEEILNTTDDNLNQDTPTTSDRNPTNTNSFRTTPMYPTETIPELIDFDSISTHLARAKEILNTIDDNLNQETPTTSDRNPTNTNSFRTTPMYPTETISELSDFDSISRHLTRAREILNKIDDNLNQDTPTMSDRNPINVNSFPTNQTTPTDDDDDSDSTDRLLKLLKYHSEKYH